ncbi:hypothetical protein Tco_0074491, partial [Tanacetum coccineum]
MASNNTLVNVSQPQIPIFKGDSYEFWSIKMKTLFKSQGLWEFVESGLPEESSENARQKETIKKIKPFHTFLQIFQRVQMRQTSGKLLQNKEECVTFTWRRKKPLMEATLVLPGSLTSPIQNRSKKILNSTTTLGHHRLKVNIA